MRILPFLSILLFVSCDQSATVDQSADAAPTVIGYEMNDENKRVDIVAGEMASTEVVSAFFDAYNNADLEAVSTMEHEDVKYYTPSGAVIEGRDAHLEMAKELAKNGATFYLNGKQITTQKAFELLENTDFLASVNVIKKDGKTQMRMESKE